MPNRGIINIAQQTSTHDETSVCFCSGKSAAYVADFETRISPVAAPSITSRLQRVARVILCLERNEVFTVKSTAIHVVRIEFPSGRGYQLTNCALHDKETDTASESRPLHPSNLLLLVPFGFEFSLPEPRFIHQALQFNIRAGHSSTAAVEGYLFFKVPLKVTQASFQASSF